MTTYGYKLSSEEHGPNELVRQAAQAEEAGFSFASISDHFHPWVHAQGHSPFVWGVLGGIAQVTERLEVLTGVTCPIIRIHPAIVAQAAATAACMLPGRFALGIGSGEALNEHILGDRWPTAPRRLKMMEEAVEVMRLLWKGGARNRRGEHFVVQNAQVYDLPEEPVEIMVAASGSSAVEVAGRIGDGIISLAPSEDIVAGFRDNGGEGKPTYAEINVCYGPDEDKARELAFEQWPITGLAGQLNQELATPTLFEQAMSMMHVEDATETVTCGPDPQPYLENIAQFVEAGYDHIWIHNIGPDQDPFFDFFAKELAPVLP
jgi:G6PDH family F420-dependent oxidoreductase